MSAAVDMLIELPPSNLPKRPRKALSNAVLGTSLFVITEATAFAGLIASFVILRSQYTNWPPMGQPRLPVEITAVNTLVLLASGVAMALAPRAARRGDVAGTARSTGLAFVLGALFLLVQGFEWARLVGYGLTSSSSVYGGLFYTLVGAHALHVLVALGVLGVVTARAVGGRYDGRAVEGLDAMRLYWLFVVAIWPVLYALVYLW